MIKRQVVIEKCKNCNKILLLNVIGQRNVKIVDVFVRDKAKYGLTEKPEKR